MPQNNELSAILAPFFQTFTYSQLEAILYAYLPTQLESFIKKTNIYAVDTFIVTAIVTLVLIGAKLFIHLIEVISNYLQSNQRSRHGEITVTVEPTAYDAYHTSKSWFRNTKSKLLGLISAHPTHSYDTVPNIFHQALSHLISKHTQKNTVGGYTLRPMLHVDHDPLDPPAFHMVPQPEQVHHLIHQGYPICLQFEPQQATSSNGVSDIMTVDKQKDGPNDGSIRVSIAPNFSKQVNVGILGSFIAQVAKDYLAHLESLKKLARTRYDYSANGKWVRICSLHEVQGLSTVALCPRNEKLVRKDISSFANNKAFYQRIGFPYRRGYLLYGQPGTGKTSLVFAVASELKRDMYFINLGYVQSDADLHQAFASVPANSVVVFEDIDTMSTVLHRRQDRIQMQTTDDDSKEPNFNLSSFLSVLDGHTLEQGIIFIMTTNHMDVLDPAIIRAGRMDIHLELSYATHHQMRKIYRMVMEDDDTSQLDDICPDLTTIPEFLIPPSEIMQVMVLFRHQVGSIPIQLKELVQKYRV
ncbi:P-loop containing nucleoside triphosphate hydrolase protein [Phycomyces nitens]|nr:P-loop containing nucleoside triphosphate hydrolase protein [Phycomyces nitens]